MLVVEQNASGTYEVKEGNFLSWTLGSIINPITLKPCGGGQALTFGALCAASGMILGATVLHKQSKVMAKAMGYKEQSLAASQDVEHVG